MENTIEKLTSLHISENNLHCSTPFNSSSGQHQHFRECISYSNQKMNTKCSLENGLQEQSTLTYLQHQYENMSMENEKIQKSLLEENQMLRQALLAREKENTDLRNELVSFEKRQRDVVHQQQELQRLQIELKTLQQTNYALQIHLKHLEAQSMNMYQFPRPPDIF